MLISVIIPTYARPYRLACCLSCVLAQDFPRDDYEIIVTDDSPDDASHNIIDRDFPQVRWIQGPRRGPAANRNHGATKASGEWLLFLDDDCEPQPGWLKAIRDNGGDDIPGVPIPSLQKQTSESEENRTPGMSSPPLSASPSPNVLEGKTVCPGKTDHPLEEHVENLTGDNFWSCNLAVRRKIFEELGGFDEDFLEAGGEDMEFAWRLRQVGVPTLFCPALLVFHPPRRIGWKGFWHRTWMIRWMALYRLKTGIQSPLIPDLILELLRTTVHLVTRFDSSRWRARLFQQIWKWITFPLILPYMIYWNYCFKKRSFRNR